MTDEILMSAAHFETHNLSTHCKPLLKTCLQTNSTARATRARELIPKTPPTTSLVTRKRAVTEVSFRPLLEAPWVEAVEDRVETASRA